MAPKASINDSKHIDRLRLEIWLFIGGFLLLWTFCMLLLYRKNRILKRKRRAGEKRIELDEEEGDAQYMISIFTGIKYKEPPTGIVKLHLIGSRYPGRFHYLINPEAEAPPVFRPLAREKFLVTEDIRLGRIVAIVLQTESRGELSTWHCQTVIVREVRSNEAWLFRVNQNIDFPPVTIMNSTEEDLTSFSNFFHRRVRREVRQGQYIYFGFWFRTMHSVYTVTQRIVTSVVCHLFLFSFSLVFLGFIFSPDDPTSIGKVEIDYNIPGEKEHTGCSMPSLLDQWLLSLAHWWVILWYLCSGNSNRAKYLQHVRKSKLSNFDRQRLKYENQLEEMDYVIGTAVHENNEKKRKEAELKKFQYKAVKLSIDSRKTSFPASKPSKAVPGIDITKNRVSLSIGQPLPREPSVLNESQHEIRAKPDTAAGREPEAKSIHDSIRTRLKSIKEFILPKPVDAATVEAPTEPPNTNPMNQEPPSVLPVAAKESSTKNKRMKYNVADALVRKFRPFPIRNSEKEHTVSKPEPENMRDAFLPKSTESSKSSSSANILHPADPRNLHDKIAEKMNQSQPKQPQPSASSSAIHTPVIYYTDQDETVAYSHYPQQLLGNTPLEKRTFMRQLFYVDKAKTEPTAYTQIKFSTPKLMEAGETLKMRDVPGDSTLFDTPVPPARKLYRPISAWIFVFLLVGLSFAGIAVTLIKGELHLHGEGQFFFLVLSATTIIALLLGAFIIETLKICLIAMISAFSDQRIYKKMKHQNLDAF